jgi:hypothetical protein
MADVKYCYRCGRRVSKEQPDCWYCGTSVHRTIRAERRCPYCDEVVREKAIKCASCGEFFEAPLEVERERPAGAVGGGSQTKGGRAGEGHTKPKVEAAGALEHEARRAIGHKTRPKLEAPTRFREAKGGERDLIRGDPKEREAATVEIVIEPAGPPARVESAERTITIAGDEGRGAQGEGGWFGRWRGRGGEAATAGGPRIEVRERSPYRICAICQTEIFASDNYCFHCGQKYAPRAFRFETRTYGPLNLGAYALAGALLIPNLLYYLVENKPAGWLLIGSALASGGVLLNTALRSDDRRNRIVSSVLLAIALAVAAVPLFLTYGPN